MASNLHLDHVAIPIFEVEASYEFYRRVLGLSLLDALSGDDWGGKPWLIMIFGLSDDRQLALCALRGAANVAESELPEDVRHFAFACESRQDLAAWKDRLTRHGVEFSEEDRSRGRRRRARRGPRRRTRPRWRSARHGT
jgi:catechol 2,3-dioxygenase-like lactoylglutathione lyase family enzyme